MNLNNFTIKSQEVLQQAQVLVQTFGQQQIENEHLLKAILEIDEKTVDSKYQTVTSGSTIITISRDYLKNLKLGNHTVKVNFTDGSATTTLKVTNNESSPNTLDNINKYVLIGIISAIVIIAAATILIIKKKNRN